MSLRGEVETMVEFDSVYLLRMRREALRKGVWFKVLNRAERAILNLVPRCMGKPRSAKLIEMLAKMIVKVKEALKSEIANFTSHVGKPLARKLSRIAQKWGHKTAHKWATDERFAKYLAIVNMNDIPAFRVSGKL